MCPRYLVRSARLAILLVAAASSGCAPLTFSNEPSVDFARYPSVVVDVGGPDGSQRQGDYLEGELREHSGFRRVLRAGAAAAEGQPSEGSEAAAAQLLVELTLDSSIEVDFFSDDELDTDVSYSATVRYQLFADGTVVDSGLESAEDEPSSFDAAEEALDLVVLHYLRPYRL